MVLQLNYSFSNSSLSYRFVYQNAYLTSPVGSWMSISKLIHLKPNSWFLPPRILPKLPRPPQYFPSQSLTMEIDASFYFTPHISKPISSTYFSPLSLLLSKPKPSYCNSFPTGLPCPPFTLLLIASPIATWIILLNNDWNHVNSLLKTHHSWCNSKSLFLPTSTTRYDPHLHFQYNVLLTFHWAPSTLASLLIKNNPSTHLIQDIEFTVPETEIFFSQISVYLSPLQNFQGSGLPTSSERPSLNLCEIMHLPSSLCPIFFLVSSPSDTLNIYSSVIVILLLEYTLTEGTCCILNT